MSTPSSPTAPYAAYLFVYFIGESEDGEQVYFSLSRDGLHWSDLNNGQPVLRSRLGEKGVRDPFILRAEEESKFYIVATDLRIASGKGWDVAQYEGSRSVIVWESEDLVNWSAERSAEMDVPGAGCVWAPETCYDEATQSHWIFWASMVEDGQGGRKQIIYGSHTKDFRGFSKPERFIERGNHVIDTTIIREGGWYYRYSKDETKKCIVLERSRSLTDPSPEELSSPDLDSLFGVEGPAIFKFNDRNEWCLLVDQYATGKGYLPLVTDDLAGGRFRILGPDEYDLGETKKRHGSILNLTQAEYDALMKAWG
ncbi:glycoside hydrolase family 43 protein [Cohnella fermenti]|uniref:1,4-beta-xylanase n=1 Tax=Cohnella fermenti TaxID=2565925 RepID=A0A4S4BF72_9BACL|nr:glycoside hydrolase family 43 protein [Cohnella fermenti]THF72930.1 1,4-beta-xylanase [Cohnella fermenti]